MTPVDMVSIVRLELDVCAVIVFEVSELYEVLSVGEVVSVGEGLCEEEILSEFVVAGGVYDEADVVSVVLTVSGEKVEVGTMTDAVIVVEADVAAGATVNGLGPSFDCPGPTTIGPTGAANTSSGKLRNPNIVVWIPLMSNI